MHCATSASVADMLAAVDYAADNAEVVSMSWGANDSAAFAPYASRFSRANVVFCAASGDHQRRVVAVRRGNVRLRRRHDASLGAVRLPVPLDHGAVRALGVLVDVSLVANPRSGAYIVYNGTWYVVGVTSLAALLVSGMLSLANQMRRNAGKPPLSTQNSELHSALCAIYAAARKYAAAFSANARSSVAGGLLEYSEGVGFQVPTGLRLAQLRAHLRPPRCVTPYFLKCTRVQVLDSERSGIGRVVRRRLAVRRSMQFPPSTKCVHATRPTAKRETPLSAAGSQKARMTYRKPVRCTSSLRVAE
jgi:hypothetical protein